MSELAAIWLAGLAVGCLAAATVAALLRFTRLGRAQELRLGDLLKVIAVSIGLGCVALSLLTLVA
jgi:hypothetical protein